MNKTTAALTNAFAISRLLSADSGASAPMSEAPANETSARVFHSSFACAPYRGIIRNSSLERSDVRQTDRQTDRPLSF